MISPIALMLAQLEFPATIVAGPGTTTIRITITVEQAKPAAAVVVPPPVVVEPVIVPSLATSETPAAESKPNLKRGQRYTNVFGSEVTRLTDYGAAHFYSDRSPLNADSSLLVAAAITGGGQQRMTRVSTGETWPIAPAGDPRSYSASYIWDPRDPDRLYWAAEKSLWVYRPSLRAFELLRDFGPLLKSPGYLFLGSGDGKRFVLDLRAQSKLSLGLVEWEIGSEPQAWESRTVQGAPAGMWYVGAAGTLDHQYIAVQVNGTAPAPSTLTYIARWGEDPFTASKPLLPGVVTGHNCLGQAEHVRIAASQPGDPVGYLPTGDTAAPWAWLAAIRVANLTREDFKTRDLLIWAPREFGGMHVGCSHNRITLSTYRDKDGGTAKAFHDEIVLVDAFGDATATGAPSTIKQGTFRRVAHHHSSGSTYWAQPHAVESIDGKYVIFTSDMAGQPDVYSVRIR